MCMAIASPRIGGGAGAMARWAARLDVCVRGEGQSRSSVAAHGWDRRITSRPHGVRLEGPMSGNIIQLAASRPAGGVGESIRTGA